MSFAGVLQIVALFGILLLLAQPLGRYMARVYEGEPIFLQRIFGGFEQLLYRLGGVEGEMNWREYALALLLFNLFGIALLYLLQRLQGSLPLNPEHFPSVPPYLALNTAVSFVTNTNWQNYSGESTLSYLSQMAGLAVQNFLSAATGMAVAIALIRGLARKSASTLGNFWVDLTRGTLYILLPLAFLLALLLISQGVVQTLAPYREVPLLHPFAFQGKLLHHQTLALGPVASQESIKLLGTNGGGFFGANSAHPFENPTPLSNFLEILAILLIPISLTQTFGVMVQDRRQGWAILVAMLALLLIPLGLGLWAEESPNPSLVALGVAPSGNLEGKEVRFGVSGSVLFAAATTGTSTGAVNSAFDSYTPLGGAMPLWLIMLGEVAPGGVGSGLYGMLVFVIVAVFVAGLMVGRTPEYLGKKIEPYEMKMASLLILIMPLTVLILTALAVSLKAGTSSILNPGPQGFSEILYAFTSQANNNGSAFGGLNGNTPFYNLLGALAMLIGRFWIIVPTLALAGSLARKKAVPPSAGTLPTHTPLFITWLFGIVILVGALNFVPALALGPIAQALLR
jgi:K+-transporting ATPase ATPase A chain